MQIRFTRFERTDGERLLCKKVWMDGDGALHKDAVGHMYEGKFETIELDFETEFGSFLDGMQLSQALGMGVCDLGNGRIVTKASGKADLVGGVITRTKNFFRWGEQKLLYFDLDDMSWYSGLEAAIAALLGTVPELGGRVFWAKPSAGSCVAREGEDVPEARGWHVYFVFDGDVDDLKKFVEIRLWNAGLGKVLVSESGSMLLRCAVDLSVFSPERLDFIAGAACGPGLKQDRGEAIRFDGRLLYNDVRCEWKVRSEEEAEYKERVEKAKRALMGEAQEKRKNKAIKLVESGAARDVHEALNGLGQADAGILSGGWTLCLDDGRRVKAWEALDRPAEFDGLTLSDPLEPEYGGGTCKAKIFWNVDVTGKSEVRIQSFAHGGRQWKVALDFASLVEWISRQNGTIRGVDWMSKIGRKGAALTDLERDELLVMIQKKLNMEEGAAELRGGRGYKLKDVKSVFEEAEKAADQKEIDVMITEMNKDFGVVTVSNKVRILHEEADPIFKGFDFRLYSKNDFQVLVQNRKVMYGGKMKGIGDIWLDSVNRRDLKGIVFDPRYGRDCDGFYNIFRGFTVGAKELGGEMCGGFRKVCEKAGIGCGGKGCATPTWFRHAFEVICNRDEAIFKWVIDWCADMLQNAGAERPGTVLVMKGGQGLGKGQFVYGLGALLGAHYFYASQPKHVTGNFNSHMKSLLLLFADEAVWGGDVATRGALLGRITEDLLAVEPKGIDAYQIKNHIRFIMASNNDWVVPADHDDRRFCVLEVSDHRHGDFEWFGKMKAEIDAGREDLLFRLLNVRIESNLRVTPKTDALLGQKMMRMGAVEEFYFDMLVRGDEALGGVAVLDEVYAKFVEYVGNNSRWTTRTKFTQDIKKLSGCEAKPARIGKEIRRCLLMPGVEAAREAYEKRIGQAVEWV